MADMEVGPELGETESQDDPLVDLEPQETPEALLGQEEVLEGRVELAEEISAKPAVTQEPEMKSRSLEEKPSEDKSEEEMSVEVLMDQASRLGVLGAFGVFLSKLWDKVKKFFGFEKKVEKVKVETDPVNPGNLQAVLAEKSDWKKSAETASERYGVPVDMIWTIVQFESKFDPDAENNGAVGLGQARELAWADFQAANPDFKGADRKDPNASLHFVGWYLDYLGEQVGVDPRSPDALRTIYVVYHDGPGRGKKILAGDTDFDVPSDYKDKTMYGISIDNDPQKYIEVIRKMAEIVDSGGQP